MARDVLRKVSKEQKGKKPLDQSGHWEAKPRLRSREQWVRAAFKKTSLGSCCRFTTREGGSLKVHL